mmetsp:Transcript_15383/g.43026  ORF Transcript_15383/g.43026 Transcript_15383/m.43026 type:complete len:129 (+) Transcript_15383:142-528(+)
MESATTTAVQEGHKEAIQRCRQLDQCFASLLPVQEIEGNCSLDVSPDDVAAQVQRFTQAAQWLEGYFVALRTEVPRGKLDTLKKEIHDLENELAEKGELMESCETKVKTWKSRLQRLKDDHDKRLAAV